MDRARRQGKKRKFVEKRKKPKRRKRRKTERKEEDFRPKKNNNRRYPRECSTTTLRSLRFIRAIEPGTSSLVQAPDLKGWRLIEKTTSQEDRGEKTGRLREKGRERERSWFRESSIDSSVLPLHRQSEMRAKSSGGAECSRHYRSMERRAFF